MRFPHGIDLDELEETCHGTPFAYRKFRPNFTKSTRSVRRYRKSFVFIGYPPSAKGYIGFANLKIA
jgi:hypothetical protein